MSTDAENLAFLIKIGQIDKTPAPTPTTTKEKDKE
jgi:hypothetical protein